MKKIQNLRQSFENSQLPTNEVKSAFITWLNSFPQCTVEAKITTYHDLVNGHILVLLLQEIDDEIFDSKLLKKEPGTLEECSENMKILCGQIKKFYSEKLGQIIEKNYIKIEALQDSSSEMERLIQLILGLVVQCDSKQKYIEGIMELEEQYQNVLMGIIKGILNFMNKSGVQTPKSAHSRTQLLSDRSFQSEPYSILNSEQRELKLLYKIEELESENAIIFDKYDQIQKAHSVLKIQYDQLSEEYLEKVDHLQTQVHEKDEQLQQYYSGDHYQKLFEKDVKQYKEKVEEIQEEMERVKSQYERKLFHFDEELQEQKMIASKAEQLEETVEFFKSQAEALQDQNLNTKVLQSKIRNYEDKRVSQQNEIQGKIHDFKKKIVEGRNQITMLQLRIKQQEKKHELLRKEKNLIQSKYEELNMTIHKTKQEEQKKIFRSKTISLRQIMEANEDQEIDEQSLQIENITLRKRLDSINLEALIKNSNTEIQGDQISFLEKKLNEISLQNEDLKSKLEENNESDKFTMSNQEQKIKLLELERKNLVMSISNLEKERKNDAKQMKKQKKQFSEAQTKLAEELQILIFQKGQLKNKLERDNRGENKENVEEFKQNKLFLAEMKKRASEIEKLKFIIKTSKKEEKMEKMLLASVIEDLQMRIQTMKNRHFQIESVLKNKYQFH